MGEAAGSELEWVGGMNGPISPIGKSLPTEMCPAAVHHIESISHGLHKLYSVAAWWIGNAALQTHFSCVLVTRGASSSNISHTPGPISLLQQKASPSPEMAAPSAELKLPHSEIRQRIFQFNPYYMRVTVPIENHQGKCLHQPWLDAMLHLSSPCKSLPEQGKAG